MSEPGLRGDRDLADDHPLALQLSSLHDSLAKYQSEAYHASLNLQHHVYSSSLANERIQFLESQLSLLTTELDVLRNTTPPAVPPLPTSLSIPPVTAGESARSARLLSTLQSRTTDLTNALTSAHAAKLASESAFGLAFESRAQIEVLRERCTHAELAERQQKERGVMLERVIEQYAALVRGKMGLKPLDTGNVDEGVREADVLREEIVVLEKRLADAEAALKELEAQRSAEMQASRQLGEELAKMRVEMDRVYADDEARRLMVEGYMSFSQNTVSTLQDRLQVLSTRHNATVHTLHSTIDSLSAQLSHIQTENSTLRKALDDATLDLIRESQGRREEIRKRIKLVLREERLSKACRDLRLRLGQLGLNDQVHRLADGLVYALDGGLEGGEDGLGSVGRLIVARSTVDMLSSELEAQMARRVELEKAILLGVSREEKEVWTDDEELVDEALSPISGSPGRDQAISPLVLDAPQLSTSSSSLSVPRALEERQMVDEALSPISNPPVKERATSPFTFEVQHLDQNLARHEDKVMVDEAISPLCSSSTEDRATSPLTLQVQHLSLPSPQSRSPLQHLSPLQIIEKKVTVDEGVSPISGSPAREQPISPLALEVSQLEEVKETVDEGVSPIRASLEKDQATSPFVLELQPVPPSPQSHPSPPSSSPSNKEMVDEGVSPISGPSLVQDQATSPIPQVGPISSLPSSRTSVEGVSSATASRERKMALISDATSSLVFPLQSTPSRPVIRVDGSDTPTARSPLAHFGAADSASILDSLTPVVRVSNLPTYTPPVKSSLLSPTLSDEEAEESSTEESGAEESGAEESVYGTPPSAIEPTPLPSASNDPTQSRYNGLSADFVAARKMLQILQSQITSSSSSSTSVFLAAIERLNDYIEDALVQLEIEAVKMKGNHLRSSLNLSLPLAQDALRENLHVDEMERLKVKLEDVEHDIAILRRVLIEELNHIQQHSDKWGGPSSNGRSTPTPTRTFGSIMSSPLKRAVSPTPDSLSKWGLRVPMPTISTISPSSSPGSGPNATLAGPSTMSPMRPSTGLFGFPRSRSVTPVRPLGHRPSVPMLGATARSSSHHMHMMPGGFGMTTSHLGSREMDRKVVPSQPRWDGEVETDVESEAESDSDAGTETETEIE